MAPPPVVVPASVVAPAPGVVSPSELPQAAPSDAKRKTADFDRLDFIIVIAVSVIRTRFLVRRLASRPHQGHVRALGRLKRQGSHLRRRPLAFGHALSAMLLRSTLFIS